MFRLFFFCFFILQNSIYKYDVVCNSCTKTSNIFYAAVGARIVPAVEARFSVVGARIVPAVGARFVLAVGARIVLAVGARFLVA